MKVLLWLMLTKAYKSAIVTQIIIGDDLSQDEKTMTCIYLSIADISAGQSALFKRLIDILPPVSSKRLEVVFYIVVNSDRAVDYGAEICCLISKKANVNSVIL